MLTTVLRAFVSISPTLLSSSGNIFQPFLLPRHFLILKDISCGITGLSHLTGLVFLEKIICLDDVNYFPFTLSKLEKLLWNKLEKHFLNMLVKHFLRVNSSLLQLWSLPVSAILYWNFCKIIYGKKCLKHFITSLSAKRDSLLWSLEGVSKVVKVI